MSEESSRDPIIEESKFCAECEQEVLQLVEYVRNLENAQKVAKRAIETLSALNKRLTEKYHKLHAEFDVFAAKLEKQKSEKEATKLKRKFEELDKQVLRFENKMRLSV